MLQRNKQLMREARKGHVKRLERLLRDGADVNCRGKYGYTPLMAAASAGQLEAVRFLLRVGADPLIGAYDGAPPMFFACVDGHTEVVKEILAAGANPNALRESDYELRSGDSRGVDLLHMAIRRGFAEIAVTLVESGANIDHVAGGKTPLQEAQAAGMPSVVEAIRNVRRQ